MSHYFVDDDQCRLFPCVEDERHVTAEHDKKDYSQNDRRHSVLLNGDVVQYILVNDVAKKEHPEYGNDHVNKSSYGDRIRDSPQSSICGLVLKAVVHGK